MNDAFQSAALAAGALAVECSDAALTLHGDAPAMGLAAVQMSQRLTDLIIAAAPGDRAVLSQLAEADLLDRRLRLLGEDGHVRYVRLIGRREGEVWRGLLLPAGQSPGGFRQQPQRTDLLIRQHFL